MSAIDMTQVDYLVELRGVYDGWSVAVMKDGSQVNRWEQGTKRHAVVAAFLAGEPSNGRWY